MEIALKLRDLDEKKLAAYGAPSKLCSGCDPDVPGHQKRESCTVCRGSGREALGFAATFSQLESSRQEEALQERKGRRRGEDEDMFLEY